MDFGTFITNCYAEVANKNAQTLTQLRRITIRQLKELSSMPFLDMEVEGRPFQTVIARDSYGPEVPGFPANAIRFERLWYQQQGGQKVEIPGPKPMQEIRFNWGSVASAQYPWGWGYAGQHLMVAPAPNAVVMLYLDFVQDATRDEETGLEITEDNAKSSKMSNPWFQRGELALRNSVLMEYFSMSRWADDAAAQRYAGLRNQYLDTMSEEYYAKKGAGGQPPIILGEIGREPQRPYLFLGGL